MTRLLTTRNSGLDVLQDVSYIYDPVGNIVEMKDQAQQTHFFNNAVIEPRGLYEYDALYRLVKAQGREKSGLANAFSNADMGIDFPIPHNGVNSLENYTHLYAYDKLGNIMSMNSQGKWLRNYVYAAASNLLLKHDAQQTTDDYTYDAHGNITRMPGIEDMQWNYADYLAKTQCGTVNTWYVYDQAGNRSRKITEKQGGIREERIYLGGFEVYRKYQGGALVSERSTVHIMDDKSRVAIIDRQTVENGVAVTAPVNYRYQYSNHLGSASLELDQTAQIISYEEYHPFGTTSYWSGQSESEVKKKRYRYVGKERDEETGLYYYGARYYAAWIGRFVSVDPMKEERQWVTPYNYCQNNPVNKIDSTGALDGDPPYKGADPDLFVDDPSVIKGNNGGKLKENPYWEEYFPESNSKEPEFEQDAEFLKYLDIFEKEVDLRIPEIMKDLEGLDVNSKKYELLQYHLSEYLKTKSEIADLRNDKDNIYKIIYGANLKENVNGQVVYGGEINGKNVIEIRFKTQIKNPMLNIRVFSHELKHAHQYFEGRLGWLLKNNKVEGTSNSIVLETEANMRGDLFAGPTMLVRKKFNKTFDPNKFVLDSYYEDKKYPYLTNKKEYEKYAFENGFEAIFNKR